MAQEDNSLRYTCSNECIDAVLTGLGMNNLIHPKNILAVGGSGDVAFALLPYVHRLVVVDKNPAQISLIRERAGQLRDEDYKNFLDYNLMGSCESDDEYFERLKANRTRFFSQEGMLDMIRSKLDKLVILNACDLIEALETETTKYSGIYVSNVLGCLLDKERKIPEYLTALKNKLDSEGVGLLYVSDGEVISTFKVAPNKLAEVFVQGNLPSGLCLDKRLTDKAREYGETIAGLPAVYRNMECII